MKLPNLNIITNDKAKNFIIIDQETGFTASELQDLFDNKYTINSWEKAKDMNEFALLMYQKPQYCRKHTFEKIFFKFPWEIQDKFIDKMFSEADATFQTTSDIGSVRIGNDNFNILIKNNLGDGYTPVAVFGKDNNAFNRHFFNNFFEVFQGKEEINIYDYDCSDDPKVAYKLKAGRYYAYAFNGYVAFVEEGNRMVFL